ncbi:MAG: GTPase, partial [Spirochaetes bacterium]
ESIRAKKVLVVEDGPTLTHGGMKFGAGVIAAKRFGAEEIIDPREYTSGKVKAMYEKYPDIGSVLPAVGYGEEQIKDLEKTINSVPADIVIIATPVDLTRIIKINKKMLKIDYELEEIGKPDLKELLEEKLF